MISAPNGYDHDARELFEIPEVREYNALLDNEFPYWLFFLTRLDEPLSNRWFPAMMNQFVRRSASPNTRSKCYQ